MVEKAPQCGAFSVGRPGCYLGRFLPLTVNFAVVEVPAPVTGVGVTLIDMRFVLPRFSVRLTLLLTLTAPRRSRTVTLRAPGFGRVTRTVLEFTHLNEDLLSGVF